MNAENRCPECKAELPANAPRGLCPACLLKGALGPQLSTTDGGPSAAGTDFVPPTPAELSPCLPDLEILEFIGRGGMGMVYKARQKQLDRLVALKILLPIIARDPAFADRFAREARAMAMLSHPHIVVVHDFGQTPSVLAGKDGPGPRAVESGERLYYLVMEFVDGLTLRQLLTAGQLAPQQALAIVPQICEALQYAHDKGVVHRDIKPENILIDRSGQVKIADFGLAKLVGREARDLTITAAGQVMGTLHYMAPEQMEHPQEVDHRADIYSLGVVFYQMLTGDLPLGRFAPPSQKVSVDVRLDEVVLRALEREPKLRYQQASQVKTEIERIAETPQAAAIGQGPPKQLVKPSRRRPVWIDITIIILAFIALLWGLYWVLGERLLGAIARGRSKDGHATVLQASAGSEILASGAPAKTGPSPAVDYEAATVEVRGFRFDLQIAKRVWAADEMPRFTVNLRYTGPRINVPSTPEGCLLELDGSHWMLRHSAPGAYASMTLAPGEALTYAFRLERDADGRGLHLCQLEGDRCFDSFTLEAFDAKTKTIHTDRRFTLPFGSHTARFGTSLFRSPDGLGATTYSNPVTFEVRAENRGALLEFRIVPNPPSSHRQPAFPEFVGKTRQPFAAAAVKELAEKGPSNAQLPGSEFGWFELARQIFQPDILTGQYQGKRYVLLCAREPYALRSKAEGKDAWGLAEVSAGKQDQGGQQIDILDIRLDRRGGELFGAFTKVNLQNLLAVVVDGRVISIMKLTDPINDRMRISGLNSLETQGMVNLLKAGISQPSP